MIETSKIYNEDCIDTMKRHPEACIDLVCCDPPYGYSFMGKDWDTFNEVVEPKGAYSKIGFNKLPRNKPFAMYEAFLPIWTEALRILKPGGFAYIMASPRQDVLCKQILALSDAGFNVGFSSIYWAYASGFPKANNIGRMASKRMGEEVKGEFTSVQGISSYAQKPTPMKDRHKFRHKPQNQQAQALDGSYAGFQPKPAVEVIIVAMKPLSEKTYVDQALKNRKGITWLDDCRVPYQSDDDENSSIPGSLNSKPENSSFGFAPPGYLHKNTGQGRFPANLLVSDGVVDDGTDHQGQSGATTGNEPTNSKPNQTHGNYQGYRKAMLPRGDSGSFSRYFDLDKWWEERIKDLPEKVQRTYPFLIVPKAAKGEKNDGTDNFHPTVKPVKLMSYLITLGSRPGDIIYDPFAGSGTTLIAAEITRRKWIGSELSPEYHKIAEERIKRELHQLKLF